MKVATLIFNPIGENTYVLWDDSNECAIIDCGASTPAEQATLDNFIAEHQLKPVVAVNTHGHFDHVLGVNHLKRCYNIPFACSTKDQYLLDSAAAAGNVYGIPTSDMPSIDIDLATTVEVYFGHTTLRVIPTPGHTPGGVTLLNAEEQVAFTGDTLFRESIGRTDLEGGDYPTLMRSILGALLPLGDAMKIFPGHAESSTIGHESMYNPFVVEALQEQINYKN
ncbi:MAG: MBL fold metallo-hydrolase [Alistipes sp.]|nr:MBL fold metallo-hydrolase [Alistipes sp.]